MSTASQAGSIFVQGEGDVKVSPDVAYFRLSAVTKSKDAKMAQEKNASLVEKVKKTLKGFKVEESKVQTTSFHLQPEYSYSNEGKQKFLGFRVEHQLSVRWEKLESLGSVLDQLVTPGSDDQSVFLQGISFDSSKRKEKEIEAMQVAMKDAEARAKALASYAGKKIKGVEKVSDSFVGVNRPGPMGDMMSLAMAKSSRGGESTQISAGELAIESRVSVEFLME